MKLLVIYGVKWSDVKTGVAGDERIHSETYRTNSLSCIFGESEPKQSALYEPSKDNVPYLHVMKYCST